VLAIFALVVGVYVVYYREGEVRLEEDTVQTSPHQVDAIEKAFQWLEKKEMEEHWVQCVDQFQIWREFRNMVTTINAVKASQDRFEGSAEKAIQWLEKKEIPHRVSLEGQTAPSLKVLDDLARTFDAMYSPLDKWFEKKQSTCLLHFLKRDLQMQLKQWSEKKIMEEPWIECAVEFNNMKETINTVKTSQDKFKDAIEKAIQWLEKKEISYEEITWEGPIAPRVEVLNDLTRTFDAISSSLYKWLENKRSTCRLYYLERDQHFDL